MLRYCKIYLPTNQISAIEDNYLFCKVKDNKEKRDENKETAFQ